MNKITPELIKAEVERFWKVFASKSAQALADFYAHEASVFGSGTNRSEPGRLAATRREREYCNSQSIVKASVGYVDVLLIGDNVAVASYNFEFHASKIATGLNKAGTEDITNGRATQVFSYDAEGKLRIMHEHFSVPMKVS